MPAELAPGRGLERAAMAETESIASWSVRGLADEEMADEPRPVVPLEAVAVIETDVAEQRNLEAQADPSTELEVEGSRLSEPVPGISRVEEHHTMERMGNGKLLLDRVQQHEAAARIPHLLERRGDLRNGGVGAGDRRVGAERDRDVVNEFLGQHHVVVGT